ncbi:hypothetical protein RvY_07111 [Ramazzottius varieornatus]|uniref:ERCC4 domain-containing protein n=1 Tax=Ramazzottius varieornatus TaxID=947166 RepID=A0A1D1V760_RAMVA|nr:hypothetical protein RvY_07111 [Ramazzottius varieornatus]
MAGEDSDSDIECVYVSESNPPKARKQSPQDEAVTILSVTNDPPQLRRMVCRRSPSLDGSPPPREDWEVLFGSGSKSPTQSFFHAHSSSSDEINPADQPILLGSDESDLDIICVQDNSLSERQEKPSAITQPLFEDRIDETQPSTSRSDEENILQTVDVSLLSIQSQTSPDDFAQYSDHNTPSSSQNGLADVSMHSVSQDRGISNDGDNTAVSKKKKECSKKLSDGEVDAKEAKRLEKEAKKAEKEKEAERTKKEKEGKAQVRKEAKHQKEAEKLKKLALKEAYRPMQGGKKSLEHLKAHIPVPILDAIGRDVLSEVLEEIGTSLRYEEVDTEGPAASVVRWTRSYVTAEVESADQAVKMFTKEQHVEEKDVLIQIPKKELVAMVDTYKQLQLNHIVPIERESFISFQRKWKDRYPGNKLHFFVYGIENYFKNQLSNAVYGNNRPARAKQPRKSILDIHYQVTYADLDEAMIDFSCCTGGTIVQVESPKEYARLIISMHKSIAESVSKELKQQETALFDAISANTKTKGVFVSEDDDNGYRELWVRQLEQFSLVSRDVAITIVNLYPSPRLLAKAYDDCSTELQKEQLLEDVIIRRGTERRIGPKMSRLLYLSMCSENGEELLGDA